MEFSEVVAALVSIVFGAGMWGLWLRRLFAVHPLVAAPGSSWWVASSLGVFTLINFIGLRTIAASDVRNDPAYLVFYLILGLGVSGIALLGLGLFGVRPSDVSQRHNRAAAVFVALTLTASAFAYAGANIGEGPGFHVVLFCTLLSLGSLFAILALHAAIAHTAYRILVDRDAGTAFRAGCMLVACGICLGRAAGGSWVSLDATLADFIHYGWPAVALCAADIVMAWATRTLESDRSLPVNVIAGVAEIALAVAYLGVVGIPA